MLYGETNIIKTESGETLNGFVVAIPNPSKSAIIRVPTGAESSKFWTKAVARKNTDDKNAELELFNMIRLDSGEPFDEYEAEFIITKITGSETLGSERTADGLVVSIKTPFGEVSHTLRMPTFKEMTVYHKAATSTKSGVSLNAMVNLFDNVHVKLEGYAPTYTIADVPFEHKWSSVNELIRTHQQIDPIQIDPNA